MSFCVYFGLPINPVTMKKLLLFSLACISAASVFAQKQKEKNSKTGNAKEEARTVVLGTKKEKSNKGNDVIWDGTRDSDGGGPKPSRNQPAKVRASFAKDYPRATAVSWSKYRGDWTANFTNNLVRSVAVYHANGDRKDTRTVIQKPQLPKTILDGIFRRRPNAQLDHIIKIEVPKAASNIFRIKTTDAGVTRFVFYDADGKEVGYDY